ncbi:MAG: hypothetical protein D6714_17435 [Bacteroidetes bacterium]|nr:MAG: hypothetical protein D6714_17435 [Bacteroidota bacterium]
MTNRILFLAIALFCFSCKNEPGASSSQAAPAAQPQGEMLPSLPTEKLQYLWENCDYVDYIFYNLPISMSLNEKSSIQYALRHIAADPARIDPNCKPIGRIFYQVKGENVLEADIYFQQGCTYFKFLENNKPAYANYMTDEGIRYLNENISRGTQMKNQVQQGGQ